MTGDTYNRVAGILALIGLHIGSEQYYHKKVVTKLDGAVRSVTQRFLAECRKKTPNQKDMHIMIDAGWSHPGWWARECTVIAVDGKTNLPVAMEHIIRGENYKGSSRGSFYVSVQFKSVGMEGYGVLKIMNELSFRGYKVTHVIHDKDSSTLRNVMDVFEDVNEVLCLGNNLEKKC